MDGLAFIAGGLGHALGGAAGRGAQHHIALGGEQPDDAVDNGGFAGAGAAGDHQHALLQGADDGVPLLFAEADAPIALKAVDVPVRAAAFHRGQRGHQLAQALGHLPFRRVEGGQIDPFLLAVPALKHHVPHEGQLLNLTVAQRFLHMEQLRCAEGQLPAGQIHMPHGGRRVPQHVLHRRLDAVLAVRGDAQRRADAVGGEKAHPFQILAQAVGVLADDLRCALAVQAADFHRQAGRNAVGLQKHHGLPGLLLLAEAFGNLNPALLAHLGHFLQPLGMLAEDGEGLLAEMLHDQLGCRGPHAVDQPASQVALNAQQGGGLLQLAGGAFQLPPVLGMLHPFPGEYGLLSRGQLGQHAHHGDFAAAHPGHHHRVAVFVIAVYRAQHAGLHLLHASTSSGKPVV